MSEYPKSVWDLLERIEPAGLHGLPIEDLPADVLKAAELAGLVRVFNKRPGPKVVYVVSADAPRDRSYIPPRPMPDPVRMVGMTPAGLEALRAHHRDAALAALEPSTGEPVAGETKPRVKPEALEPQIANKLARDPYITAENLRKDLSCGKGTVTASKAWKLNQARLKLARERGKDPRALDLTRRGEDGELFDSMALLSSGREPKPADEAERLEGLIAEQAECALTDNPDGPQRPVRKRV